MNKTNLSLQHLTTPSGKTRARALGLKFSGVAGFNNAITDVAGVKVGYSTLVEGSGALSIGKGPVRTGVTAIFPRSEPYLNVPVFAGYHSFNGNGELSGSHYIEEVGQLSFPITITNTHSCGIARDATLQWVSQNVEDALTDDFALPVSAETYDGFLNDINGFHVKAEHVFEAIDAAQTGPIEEGSVGGGTGMKCFEFKAGSGSASRVIPFGDESYTLGVFVQANFGKRSDLTILGKPIGKELLDPAMIKNSAIKELGSIIVVIATDAPLLPHQLKRLARRSTLGLGRLGTIGNHSSGDIFLAFSTHNEDALAANDQQAHSLSFIADQQLDPFFEVVVQGVEESVINSMVANEGVYGRDNNFVPALPHDSLQNFSFVQKDKIISP